MALGDPTPVGGAHMVKFTVEKLVRDRIPELMESQGLVVSQRRVTGPALIEALRSKLLEEATEAAGSPPQELLEELADVLEVLLALSAATGASMEDVEAARLAKHADRGGFSDGIYVSAVEAEPTLPVVRYYLARPEQYPVSVP